MATNTKSTTYYPEADKTNYTTGGTSEYDSRSTGAQYAITAFDPFNLSGKKDKSAEKNPYGALNPEQIAMTRFLGPYIGKQIAAGPQYYEGQLSAEMTPEESNYYNAKRADLMSGTLDQYLREASDPTALNDSFNREVATPTYQNFNENVLPGLLEGYSGFSTAQGNARAKALQGVSNELMTQRFTATQAAKDRALNAYPRYADVQNYVSAPRVIQQAGLDREYQDYTQANATAQANIDRGLAYLGLSGGTYMAGQQNTQGIAMIGSIANLIASIYGKGSGGASTSTTQSQGTTLNSNAMGSNLMKSY